MKHQNDKRIADFWKGLLTKKRKQELLKELEENADTNEENRRVAFLHAHPDEEDLFSETQYQQILRQLHRKMGVEEIKPITTSRYSWYAAAASIVILITTAITINSRNNAIEVGNSSVYSQNHRDTSWYASADSSSRILRLIDGSKITISPNSKIGIIASDYYKENRVLSLQGEARFEVAHNPEKPFVVWANGYSTTALGTEFIIQAHELKNTSISLVSGKVVVKAGLNADFSMKDQFLEPGQKLVLAAESKEPRIIDTEIRKSKPLISTSGRAVNIRHKYPVSLRFDGVALKSVFEEIASKHQSEIQVYVPDIDGLTFTGEFGAMESTETIVQIICSMNNLRYEQRGSNFSIYPKFDMIPDTTTFEYQTSN